MSLSQFFAQFFPEVILGIGACAVLLIGIAAKPSIRSLAPPLSFALVVIALVVTIIGRRAAFEFGPPGLLLTTLTFYARVVGLGMGLLLVLVTWNTPEESEQPEFLGLLLLSLTGLLLTASANDLVVLFFAVELVSVPSYVMVAMSRQDIRAPESAVKYFFLGAMSAAVMLYGFSFLYGVAGSTLLHSLDDLALSDYFSQGGQWGIYAVVGMLLAIGGLAFKMAAVPFHAYVADVYEGAAAPVTGFLGFVPKFAGLMAIAKLLGTTQWVLPDAVWWALWIIAALTMTVGNVLALVQSNVKRILAYSSIAHSGYMLIGLIVGVAVSTATQTSEPMRDGLAASLFYIAIYGVMNLGAFCVIAILQSRGDEAERLSDLAGLHRRYPGLALAMAVCAFSLMGFPLTAGFLGKVYLFSGAFSVGESHAFARPLVVLAVIGVINSAIGAAYYLRIAATCYLQAPAEGVERKPDIPMQWSLATCSLLMVALFIWPNGLARQARVATHYLQELHESAPKAAQGEPAIHPPQSTEQGVAGVLSSPEPTRPLRAG